MYINSENLQALQSKEMISSALLSLMKSSPYDEITITQICREAKVVRQTFYRNFDFKIDILEFHLDKIFQKYISEYFDPKIDIYAQLKSFFDFLILYKDFLLLIEKNNLFFLLNKTITTNLYKFSDTTNLAKAIKDPKHEIYVFDFLSSTICSIVSIWAKNNFEESSKTLAALTKTFFAGLEKTVNLESD